jgi:hypothetical protein
LIPSDFDVSEMLRHRLPAAIWRSTAMARTTGGTV